MLAVARTRAAEARLPVEFAEGDAHALTYPDRSFDAVVCLRMLMHVPDWRKALSELCRVSRERLVLDYPAITSVASLQVRVAPSRLGNGTATSKRTVSSVPATSPASSTATAFRIVSVHKQFVLPIALHKTIGSAGFTRSLEGGAGQPQAS